MHSADDAFARYACLSLRLSIRHTPDCIETAEHIIKLFHRRVDTPFFSTPNLMEISDGDTPNGGVECKCRYRDFSFISKMVQDRAVVTMYRQ